MHLQAFPFQIKEVAKSGTIAGLAAAFGNVDSHGDRITPGAFAKSLAAHKAAGTRPAMLAHHDLSRPVGVWTEMRETSAGLEVIGKLTLGVRDADEVYRLASDGALTGLSIGYRPVKERFVSGVNQVEEIDLKEISLVAVPSNDLTRIVAVKEIEGAHSIRQFLRAGGYSAAEAKAAAAAAWAVRQGVKDPMAELLAEQRAAEFLEMQRKAAARIAAIGV